MADAPWRCSQCGTVNEPVANACRTCGRWPSLFELEGNMIEAQAPVEDDDEFAAQTVEVAEPELELEVEPEVGEPVMEAELPPEFEATEEEAAEPKPRWQRLVRLVIPIGVVLYLLISTIANRGR